MHRHHCAARAALTAGCALTFGWVLAVTGCAEELPRAAEPAWRFTFERRGGIAAFSEELDIRADGGAVLRDLRTGAERSIRVPAETLAALERTLHDPNAPFQSLPTPQRSPCIDCMSYRLALEEQGTRHEVTANDAGIGAALRAVFDAVNGVFEAFASQPPG